MQSTLGMGHIVGTGSAFLTNSRQNNSALVREFKVLCGFNSDEVRSEKKILNDFAKILDAFQNKQEPAEVLAKTYLELLKKPSKEFNSTKYNFDKVLNASSVKFQQEFLNQLGILVKKEVNIEVGKISVARDSIENVKARSPILDLAKQNKFVKNFVEQQLKDLAKHQLDKNNKLFLEKLIDQEESVAKTSSSPLVARHSEFTSARSDKSKSKTKREDFEYLNTIVEYLKLCKNGVVDVKNPSDNAQLNEIELQLKDFRSTFRDTTNHISGGRIEKHLSIPSISVEASSSKPNRVAESRKAYGDIFFLSSQAFGEAENLMKKVRPTFQTSEDIAFGIARAESSRVEEGSFASSRSGSQLDLTPTSGELLAGESRAFADYIYKCNSRDDQSKYIEIDSRNLASAFEKMQKSKFTEQERSSFNKYLDIYIQEKRKGPSPITRVLSTAEASVLSQTPVGQNSSSSSL
jgi:hypothetical protein